MTSALKLQLGTLCDQARCAPGFIQTFEDRESGLRYQVLMQGDELQVMIARRRLPLGAQSWWAMLDLLPEWVPVEREGKLLTPKQRRVDTWNIMQAVIKLPVVAAEGSKENV